MLFSIYSFNLRSVAISGKVETCNKEYSKTRKSMIYLKSQPTIGTEANRLKWANRVYLKSFYEGEVDLMDSGNGPTIK